MPRSDVFHVILDSHANILIFEDTACSISGYTPSEVIGKNWFEVFIPEQNLEEVQTVFKSFFNGDISFWKYENSITCKDGTHRRIKWINTLLRDKDYQPIKVSCEGEVSEALN